MKTAVIFDLDGTLLYTLEDLTDSVNYALNQFNLPALNVEQVRSYIGNGVQKLIERATNNLLSDKETENCLTIFKKHYKQNMFEKTRPYEGVNELLDKLKANGIKTAVVSNKFDKAVKELCHFYFDGKIYSAKGECETIKKKPAPDGVLEVVKELGVTVEDCVYVGDSEVDIQTAQNAKMDCISVDWGYKDKEFLLNNGANVVVSDCSELYKKIIY